MARTQKNSHSAQSNQKKNYWVHKPCFELRHCLLEPVPHTIIHQRNRVGRVVCFRLSLSNHFLKAANCCVKSPLNLYFLVLVRILFQCASAKNGSSFSVCCWLHLLWKLLLLLAVLLLSLPTSLQKVHISPMSFNLIKKFIFDYQDRECMTVRTRF